MLLMELAICGLPLFERNTPGHEDMLAVKEVVSKGCELPIC
jgi:hypothetical protein